MNSEARVSAQTANDVEAVRSDVLAGRQAVITGGSKGIGLGIADALLAAGANVTLTARGAGQLTLAAEKLQARYPGQEVHTVVGDAASNDDAAFAQLDAILPAVDVVV